MRAESVTIALRWHERLQELVAEGVVDALPSQRQVDHIHHVVAAMAEHVLSDTDATAAALTARAIALGELRHIEHASVHQLLHELQVLSELLQELVDSETAAMDPPDPCRAAQERRRLSHVVRLLERQTMQTFVASYTHMLERQTSQLRQFSRLVSHEIRQPLAVLQVIARALPVTTADATAVRMMDIFDRSVMRLAAVTGKLERLARITPATDLSPSERSVDLTAVAHRAASQLADTAAAAGVEVHVRPALPVLRVDVARAELVLFNLIANGIQFADLKKPARYVEIYTAGGDEPNVIVRDNGIGMPPIRLQTVFREFVRAHAQRDDELRTAGLGLGLSIVRECMDHANGSVRVDSILGRGTTFKLTWPAAALTSAVR
jgi:signal transduction histidine kinase